MQRSQSETMFINQVFHKQDEIGNNANISIRGYGKTKKSGDKMLPPLLAFVVI